MGVTLVDLFIFSILQIVEFVISGPRSLCVNQCGK